ncbi:xanthine dehydrogenase family protein molybdopterin-binding subunit [Marinimicrococcus flavescens]|uniref:Xanthine dehydrogenase family protein molybdopterin-binding subunit n=1 Tax=Marinimicrococcus flavescens TaxID=3031815 RepID=A0AAP3V1V4_9PROT|nr:xanthine dehydrogenase family protein molybdopterin-binding subunit [Marinimicrococcus flavescens]
MNDMASAPLKFGIAQSVPRKEDPALLRGRGRYTDDTVPADALHAALVRSPWAHGVLRGVEVEAARAAPGVAMVITGADLEAAGYGSMPCAAMLTGHDGKPIIVPHFPALATDRVRWVGQPVAMVVADTPARAREAAELVELSVDELPAVSDPEAALAPGAPQLFEEMPGNQAVEWRWGDHGAVAEAFAKAAHVTRLRVVNNRLVVNPMEPRGAVARFEDGRWLVQAGCQGVFGLRQQIAAAMNVEPDKVRVEAGHIGGSFGMKASVFPEYVPLLHAARHLGRPVRWMNDRSESFLSDYHGRDSVMEGALALDADGAILALDVKGTGNLGAYVSAFGPAVPTMVIQKNLPSAYRLPVMAMTVRCAVTNTVPTTAYRGAGRPEAVYLMERLVETAARETGRDPLEFRRRNLVRPEEMPYAAASGLTYDSGDFPEALEMGLARAGWGDIEARRREAAARGRLLGAGLCCYAEVTAGQGKEMGGIRFGADGKVTLITGTLDYGQGHASPFAQVLADRLGIPFESIELLQGDSDQLLFGGGTGGSRSIMASGAAMLRAAEEVVENGRKLSAHFLEAAETDIRFAGGSFTVAGTDRSIGIMELARRTAAMEAPPEGLPGSLDASLVADTPPSTFPNGCHVAEVEIDPETGVVALTRYVAIDDFGTLVNPMLVEGQVHGGVVQGIGQALLEHTVYDESGQLLSGSFMDYAMPRADDLPDLELDFLVRPATTNELGVKGCGEAGITAAPPAVMNAVLDALAPLGIRHLDMPATPLRVWQAIREARATAA